MIARVLFVLIAIQTVHAAFQSVFTFGVENCTTRNYFLEDNQATNGRTLLGGFQAIDADCLDGKGALSGFANASNGVMFQRATAQLRSDFVVQDVLRSFAGDIFSISIWFSLAAGVVEKDQVLLQVGDMLKITPLSAEVVAGANILVTNFDLLPALNAPNTVVLIVLSVGLKTGRISRRVLGSSTVAMERTLTFPESYGTQSTILVPRMSSWPSATPFITKFQGNLFGVRFNETNVSADAIYRQGVPDWRPRCPTIQRNIVGSADEHTASFVIPLTGVAVPGTLFRSTMKYSVLNSPLYGDLLGDDGKVITKFPALVTRLTYVDRGSDFRKNDTFLIRAASDLDSSCLSASTATVLLQVINVNDPPEASPTSIVAGPTSGALISLGGTDPDGDVREIRGGQSRVMLAWDPSNLCGRLFLGTCDNPQAEIILTTSSTFQTINGTGWPALFCYYPDYRHPKFIRTGGVDFVGRESFDFRLVDEMGSVSRFSARATIDVSNPITNVVNLEAYGQEETMIDLNLTQPFLTVTRAFLVHPPLNGLVYAPRQSSQLLQGSLIPDIMNIAYMPAEDFVGDDVLTVKLENELGYISPLVTLTVHVSNTFDASRLSKQDSMIRTKLYERILIGLTLINRDPDAYQLQISAILSDSSAGQLAIGNLSATGAHATRGSSCLEMGCYEPIVITGFPSQVAKAIKQLEYISILPQDNEINISLSDDYRNTTWSLIEEIGVSLVSGDPTVWGSTATARGDRTVGAAIVGTCIAFLIVFGRGAYRFLPVNVRNCIAKAASRLQYLRMRGRSENIDDVFSRAKLNPPPMSRFTEGDSISKDKTSETLIERSCEDGPTDSESATTSPEKFCQETELNASVEKTTTSNVRRWSQRMGDFIFGISSSPPTKVLRHIDMNSVTTSPVGDNNVSIPSSATSSYEEPDVSSSVDERVSHDMDQEESDVRFEDMPPPLPPRPHEFSVRSHQNERLPSDASALDDVRELSDGSLAMLDLV